MPKVKVFAEKVSERKQVVESRRKEAVELVLSGVSKSEAARRTGAHRQSVIGWCRLYEKGGWEALEAQGHPGPASQLTPAQRERLAKLLVAGPAAQGLANQLWTLERVSWLMDKHFGLRYSITQTATILKQLGFSHQRPARRARERKEEQVQDWKTQRWPELVEQARAEERTLVFIDESGLSQRPARLKTWAPVGQTPVIEFNFNWKSLSAIAGLTLWNFYFQLHPGAIKAEQLIGFVEQLRRRLPDRKLLIIWDNLPAHRSRAVADYLHSTGGQVIAERLPAYAPELNPVEYLWGYWKRNEMANLCPQSLWELSDQARRTLFSMQRRSGKERLLRAFWVQADLLPQSTVALSA